MRIVTINVNGIRSAVSKGFFDWVLALKPDVVCLQELKAQEKDLQGLSLFPKGYQGYFHCAEKKGYSGVGIYSKRTPDAIEKGLCFPIADQEGRFISLNIGGVWIASVYFPSGTSGEIRQNAKYEFCHGFRKYLENIKKRKEPTIFAGDFNIAHRPIDLKNWRSNQTHSGFLPEERAWMDQLFDKQGLIDGFRVINQGPDQYTWWSNRGRAWEKNVGWRIDYQITTQDLHPFIKSASIYKDMRFSDHAPLIMEYDV